MSTGSGSRTLFFFEKPSAMRQLQRFFKSPTTVCVSAEGHLLAAQEPGDVRPEWKPWRFDALPIVLDHIPTTPGKNRSGQSHRPKIDAIKKEIRGVQRVIIATDPGREGSMIAWEVLEHLGYTGRVDRLKLGAVDETSYEDCCVKSVLFSAGPHRPVPSRVGIPGCRGRALRGEGALANLVSGGTAPPPRSLIRVGGAPRRAAPLYISGAVRQPTSRHGHRSLGPTRPVPPCGSGPIR